MTIRQPIASMEDERRHEQGLVEAILEYLAEHPQASDTLEGIAEWWIMRQQVRVEVSTLARVLRQLTESGLIEKIGQDTNARYQLTPMGKTGCISG